MDHPQLPHPVLPWVRQGWQHPAWLGKAWVSGHLSGTQRRAGAVSSFADIMILLLFGARATPHPGHKTQVTPVVSAPCSTTWV